MRKPSDLKLPQDSSSPSGLERLSRLGRHPGRHEDSDRVMQHSGPTGLPARGSSRRSRLVYSEVPWFEGYAPLKKSEKRRDLNRKFEKWRILYSEPWRLTRCECHGRHPVSPQSNCHRLFPNGKTIGANWTGGEALDSSGIVVGRRKGSALIQRAPVHLKVSDRRSAQQTELRSLDFLFAGAAWSDRMESAKFRPNVERRFAEMGLKLGNRLRKDVAGGAERDRSLRERAPQRCPWDFRLESHWPRNTSSSLFARGFSL